MLQTHSGAPLTFRGVAVVGLMDFNPIPGGEEGNIFALADCRIEIPVDSVDTIPVEDESFTDSAGRVFDIIGVALNDLWYACACRLRKR